MAEALREIDPELGFLFLGGRRGREAELVPAAGIAFHATPMPSLRDPESRLALLRTIVAVPLAFVDALVQLVRFKPDVCCTTGGVVAIPVTLAARALFVPVYLWDGNALPGRATRLLGRISSRIGVTYEQARQALPRGRTVLAGTPIRASLLKWTRERGREIFAVPADATLVVVSGGSQGSERVNDALWSALGRLIRRAYVLHITGEKHGARADARRANLPDEVRDHYIVRPYLGDEMGGALAAADLAIGRAGASSIAEPLAFGVPLLLIPFGAAMEGHQEANARAMVETGAAITMREGELDGDRLTAQVIGLLQNPEGLRRMANAARSAGRPDAARDIARDLLALGGCA
ncbi:MAG TPA: UDP-N-acetylglucosamine--N-acetylmuramyl-(pentapeptide) pyrophosphoryl-undecaprenol N-acetylglucosamine transferase [Candidatus Limnocylindria bacterium]|nr:UDP-N-acetylglucosamine--N-acetylmuramyl-(pentapeptide) pyrophosphoryl-undecaprenol N-acetylglucosamine transferase [Candidatus Limnocylindria bacterium]